MYFFFPICLKKLLFIDNKYLMLNCCLICNFMIKVYKEICFEAYRDSTAKTKDTDSVRDLYTSFLYIHSYPWADPSSLNLSTSSPWLPTI